MLASVRTVWLPVYYPLCIMHTVAAFMLAVYTCCLLYLFVPDDGPEGPKHIGGNNM